MRGSHKLKEALDIRANEVYVDEQKKRETIRYIEAKESKTIKGLSFKHLAPLSLIAVCFLFMITVNEEEVSLDETNERPVVRTVGEGKTLVENINTNSSLDEFEMILSYHNINYELREFSVNEQFTLYEVKLSEGTYYFVLMNTAEQKNEALDTVIALLPPLHSYESIPFNDLSYIIYDQEYDEILTFFNEN